MRRSISLLVWMLLAAAVSAVAQWAGQDAEDIATVVTVDGRALEPSTARGPRHDPATCRACNIGTQARRTTDDAL